MAYAICHKCGFNKSNSFSKCAFCGSQPSTESELAVSILFSDHLSSRDDLARFARQIRGGNRVIHDPILFAKARSALLDKQLMAMLRSELESASPVAQQAPPKTPPTTRPRAEESSKGASSKSKTEKETSLHRTAFWILGATARDDRRHIVDLAEEKALYIDHEACQKARAELTNPRTRLSAEMAWMPGVSPKKARDAAEVMLRNPDYIWEHDALPTLARANLMAAAFETLEGTEDADDVAGHILELAGVAEELDPDEILRDINEDRAVSGFPEIKGVELVETELAERLRFYKGAVRSALNNMPSEKLVMTMTKAAHLGTDDGDTHAPALLDDLVDAYETETQGFLSKEAENVLSLVKKAKELAEAYGEEKVEAALDKLEKVARNWDRVAQPIQISMKARGIVHRPSQDLAMEMRGLGVHLFNKHDMMNPARRMTDLLSELFSELPEVAETLGQDSEALANIAKKESNAKSEKLQWERDIAFEQAIGLVFKDTLKISSAGVQWKDKCYPLESITRVRWGGVRHSTNGIPTGTEYTMAFGDNRSEAVVQTNKQAVFSEFTDKLWKAVCPRLMLDILKALREGKKFPLGDGVVDDTGITLFERHTFSADVPVYCHWTEVNIWDADGSFIIAKKDAKGTNASASYINSANTHLLEHLIKLNFKGSDPRLSDAL